jgi:hypothetical protein
MDRTYVTQQHKTPVFQLGLDLWRDHVVHNPTIQQRMLAIVSDLIARERAGEVIERSLIRATTQVGGCAGALDRGALGLEGRICIWGRQGGCSLGGRCSLGR